MKTNNTIRDALDLITQYGGIDGAHHKQWVLDQIVRTLTKTEKGYENWLKEYQGDLDEEGYPEYEWDKGSPP